MCMCLCETILINPHRVSEGSVCGIRCCIYYQVHPVSAPVVLLSVTDFVSHHKSRSSRQQDIKYGIQSLSNSLVKRWWQVICEADNAVSIHRNKNQTKTTLLSIQLIKTQVIYKQPQPGTGSRGGSRKQLSASPQRYLMHFFQPVVMLSTLSHPKAHTQLQPTSSNHCTHSNAKLRGKWLNSQLADLPGPPSGKPFASSGK